MPPEQQLEEWASLEAIFGADCQKVGEDPIAFRVTLVPLPGSETDNHVSVDMWALLPPAYPEVPPEVRLADSAGHHLEPFEIEELHRIVEQTVQESIGAEMMFMVCEAIKEWLVERNQQEIDALQSLALSKIDQEGDSGSLYDQLSSAATASSKPVCKPPQQRQQPSGRVSPAIANVIPKFLSAGKRPDCTLVMVNARANCQETVWIMPPNSDLTSLDEIHIRIHAQPRDGLSNKEITRHLSKTLGIAKSQLTLVKGPRSRNKIFEAEGLCLADAAKAFVRALHDGSFEEGSADDEE